MDPLGLIARDTRGLTYIEVLVAAVLLALAVGALMPMLTVGQQIWEYAPYRNAMTQNLRVTFDRLVREMRAAQSFDALSASALRFAMYSGGKSVNPTMTVEYQLNAVTGDMEYRRDTDPWQPLAGAFRSMSVTCFDAANATISCTPASSVRSVQVSLVAMDPQGVASDITITSRAYRQAP